MGVDPIVSVRLPVTKIPAAWGVYCDQRGHWHGPFANLRRALTGTATSPAGHSSIVIEHLPVGVPVRLSDPLRLGKDCSHGPH